MKKKIFCLMSVLAISFSVFAKNIEVPFSPVKGESKSYDGTFTLKATASKGEKGAANVRFSSEVTVAEKTSKVITLNHVLKGIDEIRLTENGEHMIITSEEINSYKKMMWAKLDEAFAEAGSEYGELSDYAVTFKEMFQAFLNNGVNVNLNPNGKFISITEYDAFLDGLFEIFDYVWNNVAYEYLGENSVAYADLLYDFAKKTFFSSENFKRIYRTSYSSYLDFYGNEYTLNETVPHVMTIPFFIDGIEVSYAGERKVFLNVDKNICVADKFVFTKDSSIKLVNEMMSKFMNYFSDLMYSEEVFELLESSSATEFSDYETYREFLDSNLDEAMKECVADLLEKEEEVSDFTVTFDATRILDAKTGMILGLKNKCHADFAGSEVLVLDYEFDLKAK